MELSSNLVKVLEYWYREKIITPSSSIIIDNKPWAIPSKSKNQKLSISIIHIRLLLSIENEKKSISHTHREREKHFFFYLLWKKMIFNSNEKKNQFLDFGKKMKMRSWVGFWEVVGVGWKKKNERIQRSSFLIFAIV